MTRLAVHRHGVVAVADRVDDGAIGIELLALLIVVGHLHVGAAPDLAGLRRQLPKQQPQHRRLTGAVRPDQAEAIAAHHARGEVADDEMIRVVKAHVFRFEHHLAGGFALLDLQAHVPGARAPLGALRAHGHQRLDASFVTRAARLHAAAQPHFLARHLLVELRVGQLLVGEPLLFLALERRVVAGPRRQAAAIELDDPRRQPLEERAVVRDEDDGAAVVGEEGLEPGDGFDIEVIGRLVQQQQIRLADERARQQHAALPPARQRVDNRRRRQRQPRHHHVRLVMTLPLVVRVERPQAVADHRGHRAIRRQRHVLLQPRHANARLPQDEARVRLQVAAQDLQQRGLAGAVAADDGDALAGVNLEGDLVDERQMAEGDGNTVERDERHRRTG